MLLAVKLASGFSLASLTVPVQRLGLASTLTEAAPFLLVSLAMIFAGGNASRRRLEVEALVVLQRLLLPLVIGYARLAPLVITDAFRAYRGADHQGAAQLQQSRQFRKQVVDAVEPTTSAAELVQVLRRFPQIRFTSASIPDCHSIRSRSHCLIAATMPLTPWRTDRETS